MHSTPITVLGAFFIIGGVLLAGMTFRSQKPESPAPVKKSELRAQEVEKKNETKQRIGGAILAVFGLVLIFVIA